MNNIFERKKISFNFVRNKIWLFLGLLILVCSLVIIIVFFSKKEDNNKIIKSEYSSNEEYEKAKKYGEKYPVIKVLPIIYAKYSNDYSEYTEFRIDGGVFQECNNKEFCIVITDITGGNYEDALSKIREAGYNPESYEIKYKKK